ncbi:hypothetical protein DFH06DRAFT_1121247 [Mycena polygramma]|nr:hypothetical protein DFH06DRAFT_1121247 [Mycena polygramma]
MPAKPKNLLAEQVLKLQRELKESRKQNGKSFHLSPPSEGFDGFAAKLKESTQRDRKRKLIERPVGQAGRSKGYNVRRAMGLKDDKERFLRLSRIIRSYCSKYLDGHKTLRKQDSTRVDKVIKHLMKQCKFLRRFQGGWPVRDLIQKVLQNSVCALKDDCAAEALAEQDDTDFSADEAPLRPQKKKSVKKTRKRANSSSESEVSSDGMAGSDSDEEYESDGGDEEDSDGDSSKKETKKAKDTDTEDDEMESPKKVISQLKPNPKAQPPNAQQDQQAPKKKRLCLISSNTEAKIVNSTTEHLKSAPSISSACPNSGCTHRLPRGELSSELKGFFATRGKLLAKGDQAQKIQQVEAQICDAIRWDLRIERLAVRGRQEGWPRSLDLAALVTQIVEQEAEVIDLICDPEILRNHIVWLAFLSSIDGKIHAFGMDEGAKGFRHPRIIARCGYLGPKGKFLIASTVGHMPAHRISDLRIRLSKTIDLLIRTLPEDFDSPKTGLRPVDVLSLEQFFEFVLIPHVVTCLIALDMEVEYDEAVDIKDASCDFGAMFHWNQKDPHLLELDELNKQVARDLHAEPPSDRLSPRLTSFSKSPSPSGLSPTHSLHRADFDSPLPKNLRRMDFKVERDHKPPTIKTVAPEIELTIEDFPGRSNDTRKQKAKEKKDERKHPRSFEGGLSYVTLRVFLLPHHPLAVPTAVPRVFSVAVYLDPYRRPFDIHSIAFGAILRPSACTKTQIRDFGDFYQEGPAGGVSVVQWAPKCSKTMALLALPAPIRISTWDSRSRGA